MRDLKFDRIDRYHAERVTAICDRHLPAIQSLITNQKLDEAYDRSTGLALFYEPRLYGLLAGLYQRRKNWQKYWPALIMSGEWPPHQQLDVESWMTKNSKNGPAQLRSRFPTCFTMRYARSLMPDNVVAILHQFDFFLFRPQSRMGA